MSVRLKSVAAAGMLLVLLAGCEKKPGGQVVAVVNGEEISQQELNAELGDAQPPAGADGKKVMAQLLQQVIDRKLIVQKAKAQGLETSPEYLQQERRAKDVILIQLLERQAARVAPLPDAAAVDRYMASQPTLFQGRVRYNLDQISFVRPADITVLRKLEPLRTLDAVGSMLGGAGIEFERNRSVLDSIALAPDVAKKIAALPPGEPFVMPIGSQIVVGVIQSTEPRPTVERQARPMATNMIRQQGVRDALTKQLQGERATAKISYAPGFEPPANSAAPARQAP